MRKKKEGVKVVKTKKVAGLEVNVYNTREDPLFLLKDLMRWMHYTSTTALVKLIPESFRKKMHYSKAGNDVWFVTPEGISYVLNNTKKTDIAKEIKPEMTRFLESLLAEASETEESKNEHEKVTTVEEITEETGPVLVKESKAITQVRESLRVLKNSEFGKMRAVVINDQPWFVAADVAKILGYGQAYDMTRILDPDDKGTHKVLTVERGVQEHSIINESGLYGAILGSTKDSAKRFKRWVTSEVLPSLRKHGAYIMPDKIEEILQDPDVILKLATKLKEESDLRAQYEMQIEDDKPYTDYGKEVFDAIDSTMPVGDFGKHLSGLGYDTGPKKIFQQLYDGGYLYHKRSPNGSRIKLPYQKYVLQGYFKTYNYTFPKKRSDGTEVEAYGVALHITGKGQKFITEKFRKYEEKEELEKE